MHETPGREALKLTTQKPGDFWLVDLQHVGGASLGESPRTKHFVNVDRKLGVNETFFGIGQTDVGETLLLPSST
ncbi:MAG: hypothetical protein ACRD4X_03550 [Candidatus Acidiferrales bacterium]